MKIMAGSLTISLFVSGIALAGDPAQLVPATSPKSDVCIDAGHIDHTVVVDDQTVLFFMRDKIVWKNTLPQRCPSLKFEGSFANEVRGDEICSNRQMIRVLQTGTWCSLGAFTAYTPSSTTTR